MRGSGPPTAPLIDPGNASFFFPFSGHARSKFGKRVQTLTAPVHSFDQMGKKKTLSQYVFSIKKKKKKKTAITNFYNESPSKNKIIITKI